MKKTEEKFHKELINEYEETYITLCQIKGVCELMGKYLIEYNRIKQGLTGPKSSGEIRLLIGKIFDNYYTGYSLAISLFEDNDYIHTIKDFYKDDPESYIDYDVFKEAPAEIEGYNPYKDLVKLEKYISILIEQEEEIEPELQQLYENVCEFNKLSIFEKREKLGSFFYKNYKFKFEENRPLNVMSQLYLDYKTYYEYEETCENFFTPMFRRINAYNNCCKSLSKYHEKLYFEIANFINSVKTGLSKEINLEMILEFEDTINNKLFPSLDVYLKECFEIRKKMELDEK